MHIELGALIHKAHTELVLEGSRIIHRWWSRLWLVVDRTTCSSTVSSVIMATSIITVIADEGACDEILNLLHTVCGLDSSKEGVVFAGKPLVRTSLPKLIS